MGLDSVELIMEIEDEFGIEIPDEDVQDILTLGDLHRLLFNHVSRNLGASISALQGGTLEKDVWKRLERLLITEWAIEKERIKPSAEIVRDLGMN
jgi:hypothetical protein